MTKYNGPIKEVNVVEKVKLTKEQAAFVEEWKNIKTGYDNFVRALNEGYEIEEEKPDFKAGDKVITKKGGELVVLSNPILNLDAWFLMDDHEKTKWAYTKDFRHATPEEVYWLETLGRHEVGDFHAGDAFVDSSGETLRIGDVEIHDARIESAKRWYSEGDFKGIYPAESFKPFSKEDAE